MVGLRRAFEEASDASEDSNADDEHDPEGATIAYERSQIAALIDQAQAHLAAIDAAEERLEAGTYGLCSVCGEPIPEGRLEARPTATTCVLHASASAS
nr:TraR/DksA C4-type zinc finger protein [Intrasporangium oryzae]